MTKETREHLFFHYEQSMLIWKNAPVKWDKFVHLTDSFGDWWKAINKERQDSQVKKGIELTVYLLWQIWKCRNSWQFQEQKVEVEEAVQKATNEWREYENIQQRKGTMKNERNSNLLVHDQRRETAPGAIRINIVM